MPNLGVSPESDNTKNVRPLSQHRFAEVLLELLWGLRVHAGCGSDYVDLSDLVGLEYSTRQIEARTKMLRDLVSRIREERGTAGERVR